MVEHGTITSEIEGAEKSPHQLSNDPLVLVQVGQSNGPAMIDPVFSS